MLTTLLEVGAGVLAAGGFVAAVIYYMRKSASDSAHLESADAVLLQERARVAQMEKAAASARIARVNEVNAKAAAATTPGDAAGLLQAVTRNA